MARDSTVVDSFLFIDISACSQADVLLLPPFLSGSSICRMKSFRLPHVPYELSSLECEGPA
jgi:hypothetical protein